MDTIKTVKVTFEGKEYQIRNSMYTQYLFRTELKKIDSEVREDISLMIFAWSALKGFNKDFNLTLEDVMMTIDEPQNASLIKGIGEILKTENEENTASAEEGGEKK